MKTKITDKIKTLADVGQATNCDLEAIAVAFRQLPIPADDQQYLVDQFHWIKITEALNEGKILSYTDGKTKSWPYAWVTNDPTDPSGFGFSLTYAFWTDTNTNVGVRQLFVDDATALYAIRQFPEVFKGCMLRVREVQS